MPVRRLPSSPSLEHLKHQAKDLLKGHAARDAGVAQRLREFDPRFLKASDTEIFASSLKLSEAQLAIAREYGFASWARLKARIEKLSASSQKDAPHHERIEDPVFRHAVDLLDAGDVAGLRAHLNEHPGLSRERVVFEGGNYFRNPTLLEFIAENPVRRGKLPANIVELARAILEAGVEMAPVNDTLMLVSTGSVVRECGAQAKLIGLLCDYGGDPNTALEASVLLDEHEAAQALLARGARLTLPAAAGLGLTQDFARLLPSSTSAQRHLALTMAADLGHLEIVKILLDMGESPDRYNPVGGHSHTTPLHQAAWRGYEKIVRLFVERGARLDLKDLHYDGTPADWAYYGDKPKIEAYLRQQMKA